MTDEKNGNGTVKWKTDAAEFRGFVRASMQALQVDTKSLKEKTECISLLQRDNEEIKKDVKSLHSKVGILSKKVYVISGTIALIVSIILVLMKTFIKL